MRYPGGKDKCYQRLVNPMSPHQTYVGSHLDGGAATRNKRATQRNISLDLDTKIIELWQTRLPGTYELHQVDAVSFPEGYTFRGGGLMYADPSCVPVACRREKVYRCDYTKADHIRLLRCLIALPRSVILSGYGCDPCNRGLLGWRKMNFPAKTYVEMREEVVQINFSPSSQLHDTHYLGETFRDRQITQRRQIRLRNRIEDLDPIERHEPPRWMQELYSNDKGVA